MLYKPKLEEAPNTLVPSYGRSSQAGDGIETAVYEHPKTAYRMLNFKSIQQSYRLRIWLSTLFHRAGLLYRTKEIFGKERTWFSKLFSKEGSKNESSVLYSKQQKYCRTVNCVKNVTGCRSSPKSVDYQNSWNTSTVWSSLLNGEDWVNHYR